MDIQAITSLISSVGFPIAMCLMMAYYIKSLLQNHKDEMDSIRNEINALNLTIQKLINTVERNNDFYDDGD